MESSNRQQQQEQNKKRVSSITKKIKSKSKTSNILEKFNLLGAFAWLNLSTMEKAKPYLMTDMKRHTTKLSDRLMVELDNSNKLYLPERYNSLTDRQVADIASGKYLLLNRGTKGQSYMLEVILKAEFDKISLIEQLTTTVPLPQPQQQQQQPSSSSIQKSTIVLPTVNTIEMLAPSPSSQVTTVDDENDDDVESEDEEEDETVDPNSAVLNFYSQKPFLGL
ncbi:hypothetical protein Zmor_000881 [Zophobas morio]|uniref:Uncharacterized protein n=1 Tax=Zophobas morio TaxID=2755281 RepID=A0AA38J7B9_9CUCU|nr:hypothetical protein Zmor_000881 [Zophobas morio]